MVGTCAPCLYCNEDPASCFSFCSLTESSQMLCEQDAHSLTILQMRKLGDSEKLSDLPKSHM